MARFKDYKKGNRIASIRMFGWIDYEDNNRFFTTYEVRLNDNRENEKRIQFGEDREGAIKYVEDLGFKEW